MLPHTNHSSKSSGRLKTYLQLAFIDHLLEQHAFRRMQYDVDYSRTRKVKSSTMEASNNGKAVWPSNTWLGVLTTPFHKTLDVVRSWEATSGATKEAVTLGTWFYQLQFTFIVHPLKHHSSRWVGVALTGLALTPGALRPLWDVSPGFSNIGVETKDHDRCRR